MKIKREREKQMQGKVRGAPRLLFPAVGDDGGEEEVALVCERPPDVVEAGPAVVAGVNCEEDEDEPAM